MIQKLLFPAFLWQKSIKLRIKKSYIKMKQQIQKNDSYYKQDKSDQTMTAIKRFYHGTILLNETFIVLKI
jgi:hypothetical protein